MSIILSFKGIHWCTKLYMIPLYSNPPAIYSTFVGLFIPGRITLFIVTTTTLRTAISFQNFNYKTIRHSARKSLRLESEYIPLLPITFFTFTMYNLTQLGSNRLTIIYFEVFPF